MGTYLDALLTYNVIQIVILIFIVFVLCTIDVSSTYKRKMNHILYLVFSLNSILGIVYTQAEIQDKFFQSFGILFVCACLGCIHYLFYVQKINLHTPLGYLAYYFAIIILTLFTEGIYSPFYPEVFLLAAMFASIHAGRKISFGVSVLTLFTIIALYMDGVASEQSVTSVSDILAGEFLPITFRVVLTSILLILLPQIMGYLYYRKLELLKRARAARISRV